VNCQPSKGVLCESERDFAASKVQRFLGSKMVTSAWLPRASAPRPEVEDSSGACGEKFDDACQRNSVVAMQFRDGQRQRGFQAGDAEGGALEFDLLFVQAWGAWSVAMASTVPSAKRNQ
jgi:hypothetical protein